jgi:putative transposase
VGWSIADHLRTELVVDALEMARLRRKPVGTILHSDRGTQYTSWLFGHRLREAGLMGSMGKVACAYDNALMESFWGSMQIELLDRRCWTSPPSSPTRCSSGSKPSTTPCDATPDSTTGHRSSSNAFT